MGGGSDLDEAENGKQKNVRNSKGMSHSGHIFLDLSLWKFSNVHLPSIQNPMPTISYQSQFSYLSPALPLTVLF